MEKRRILLLPNVAFEVEPENEQIGSFGLYIYHNDYRFEWVAENPKVILDRSLTNSQRRLVFRLADVQEILHQNESLETIMLKFVFKKSSTRLPLFRFRSHTRPFVLHMIEFLVNKKLIESTGDRRNSYIVDYVNPKGSKLREKEDAVLADTFNFLRTHNASIDAILANDLSAEDEPLSLTDCLAFFSKDMRCCSFNNLKREVFRRGLKADARTLMWPLLLGVRSPDKNETENTDYMKNKLKEYQTIKIQWMSITGDQEESVGVIADVFRVIDNDVRRTDRHHPCFMDDDSPNMTVLRHILRSYAVYNRDAGYVQGMGDLIAPIMELFIKDWKDNDHVILYDDSAMTAEEVESFMFWMLVGVMAVMQHDRIFTELSEHSKLVMKMVHDIATFNNKRLKNWLERNEIKDLMFLYRPILLLFKREFPPEIVARLWDSFFAANEPYSMPRFVLAALLLIMFPKFRQQTNGSLGEVMTMCDKCMREVDGLDALNLAIGLEEQMATSGNGWAMQELPEKVQYRDYVPQLFRLA